MTAPLIYNEKKKVIYESTYLLFIDKTPVNEELKNYFNLFNIGIIEQKTITPISYKPKMLTAILIHWSLLKNEVQAIHQLYKTYSMPLLIISDYPNEDVCIKVLEAGADDFIIKPIHPKVLHARINAINRRVLSESEKIKQEKEIFTFTHWRLHPTSRQVFNHITNQELELSAGEYDLLFFFIQEPQRVLNRELLLHISKNGYFNHFDRRIDIQISRLRKKIEIDAKKPKLIKTIRNHGYIFTAPVICIKEI